MRLQRQSLWALPITEMYGIFLKEKIHKVPVKIGVILRIAAAGSETSASTVITRKDANVVQKRDFSSDLLRPEFAILNTELTLTLTREQTTCGGIDIMAHVFERYFTKVENVELTDRLCEATLKTVINSLRLLLENQKNYDARAELMWAGSIAHNNLLSTGRCSDWASHMIEHEFSALYDIPHGTGLSIIFPAWMKYAYQSNLNRFVQYANKVWNIEIDRDDLEGTALKGIAYTEEFFKELGQPIRLSQINITKEFFSEIAESAIKFGRIGDFVKLGYEDIIKICMMAL